MAGYSINIDSSEVVKYTNYLEKVSKSALPGAIRNTLSKTAFHVKKTTMPKEAKKEFDERKPTFFKSASTVQPATGTNITSMRAVVGFKPVPQDKGRAVEDLEQQEHGGKIGGRTFIPLKAARAAGSWHRNVKKHLRIAALNEMFDSENSNLKGENGKENFTLSAIFAKKGGLVMGNRENAKGNKQVFLINSVKRKGKNTVVNSTPVYSVKKKRKVSPKATHFMEHASEKSAADMPETFIQEATKRINGIR